MKKKLLVTASTFPRWENDTEPRFVLDLCKAMLTYYDITVLVPATPGARDRETLEGVNVIRYHYFPVHRWETLCYPGAIVPRIREKKVRVFLVPFLLLGLYCALKKYLPAYDMAHAHWLIPQGIVHGMFKNRFLLSGLGGDVSSLNRGIIYRLKKRTLDRAEHITVVSKDLKETLINLYGIESERIEVIPMGCDINQFTPDNKVENYWGQGTRKVVLFIGRLVEKKGAEYLIRAIAGLDIKLIIVGEGPEREHLEVISRSQNSDIEFVGAKSKHEIIPMYASCDVFCIPSVVASDGDKDGTPVALIEAMASGAPVIGTEVGGISEVIRHNESGFLVKERDISGLRESIKCMISDDQLRARFSKESRRLAIHYDYSSIAKSYHLLLESNR